MPVRCNSSEIKCAPRWSASLYICVPVCTFFCKYLGPVCQENYPQVGTVCWVEKSRDYLHECVNTEGFKIFTQHVIIPFLYTTRSHEVHMVNTKERGLWTSAKTHSLCKSIIQYVHSEITDDRSFQVPALLQRLAMEQTMQCGTDYLAWQVKSLTVTCKRSLWNHQLTSLLSSSLTQINRIERKTSFIVKGCSCLNVNHPEDNQIDATILSWCFWILYMSCYSLGQACLAYVSVTRMWFVLTCVVLVCFAFLAPVCQDTAASVFLSFLLLSF